jgi:hypothetical protein
VFVATYVGASPRMPTFRPHIGCIPATGGRRTPTGVTPVVPPGMATVRRVVTARIDRAKAIVTTCRGNERLVDWYATRAFDTPAPPTPALVATLSMKAHIAGKAALVLAHARRGRGIVQVGAICAGGQ